MAFRIERVTPSGFRDYLYHLWEGNDLPVFVGPGRNPYLFDDKAEADRVAQRLEAKYPRYEDKRFSCPFTYEVVEVSQHGAKDRGEIMTLGELLIQGYERVLHGEIRDAWARYAVYSFDKYQAQFPDAVPAGRYDKLEDAVKHANTVTYKMIVVDSQAESNEIVHANWMPEGEPNNADYSEGWDDATLDASNWTKEQAIAYLDSVAELDDDYDRGHRAAIKHLHGLQETHS